MDILIDIAGLLAGALVSFFWRPGVLVAGRLAGAYLFLAVLLIMLGSVYTHWHNGDPLEDSYEAFGQLIAGGMLLLVYFLEKEWRRRVEECGKRGRRKGINKKSRPLLEDGSCIL